MRSHKHALVGVWLVALWRQARTRILRAHFVFVWSGLEQNSESNSHLPVQWGMRLRCRAQIACVYCFVLFWSRARTHASPLADGPHLFLFLLITDDPCLVSSCLTGGTVCQGAYIRTQQFVRPRRTISPWPCHSWPSPSLREPWRALVLWWSPRPRPFNRTAAWA